MNYEVNFVLINEQDEEKKNTNSTLCKICKGACCCQNCGCVYSPEDFYVLTHEFSRRKRIRYLIAFLKRGTASIEHKKMKNQLTGAVDIESVRNMGELADLKYLKISRDKLLNSEGVLYLRARNEGQGVLDYIHPNYEKDTGCALLTSEGCPYSYSKRPKGGRLLIPRVTTGGSLDCKPVYSEMDACIEWLEWQDLLYEVYVYFDKKRRG